MQRQADIPNRLAHDRYRWVVYALLLLASVQCGRAIFFVNASYLDLKKYEVGQERLPYQDRVAMMPVLVWAGHNAFLQRAAARLETSQEKTPQHASRLEEMTPEKLACVVIGVGAVTAMTFTAVWACRRRRYRLWWAGGVLVLAILYVSLGARAEMNFWYPYDLPHFAIFGVACVFLLEGMWVPFFALFVLDTPVRETSVYLLLLGSAMALKRGEMKMLAAVGVAGAGVWLPVHEWITHHVPGQGSETGVHWMGMLHGVLDPLHWPQMASAFGFLALPFWLGRRHLSEEQRVFALAMVPCLLVTLLFGMWYETRIFGEWTLPVAVMLAGELDGEFRQGPDGVPLR